MTHDRLANVDTEQVAPVAHISEAKVQVVAIQAEPVADSLCQKLLITVLITELLI